MLLSPDLYKNIKHLLVNFADSMTVVGLANKDKDKGALNNNFISTYLNNMHFSTAKGKLTHPGAKDGQNDILEFSEFTQRRTWTEGR